MKLRLLQLPALARRWVRFQDSIPLQARFQDLKDPRVVLPTLAIVLPSRTAFEPLLIGRNQSRPFEGCWVHEGRGVGLPPRLSYNQ